MAVLASLEASRVFRGVSREALGEIERLGRAVSLAAGDGLIEEGEANRDLYVVVEGELEVFLPKTAERFSRIHVATLSPGDCIGEYSFVDDLPASASVAARTAARVLALSRDAFEEALERDRGLGRSVYRNLLVLLIERLREGNRALDLFRPPRSGA